MPSMPVPLVKGDKIEGVEYRDALPVNTLTRMHSIFGVVGYMVSHPGLNKYAQGPGRDRGGVYNERQRKHYRVAGARLVQVNFTGGTEFAPTGEVVELGTITGESSIRNSQASLPYSFNTQGIIADRKFWLWNGSNLTQVTDPDVGQPIDGCWIDGYYFMTGGEYLFHTTLADEYMIDSDNFATSEFSPDPSLAVLRTQDNQVMVLNRYTTEYFRNVGTPTGFAFQRIVGKAVNAGIVGTHLKTELDGKVFILGSAKQQAPTMLIIGAGQAVGFSTKEIDLIIAGYTEDELASGGVMETRVEEDIELIYVRLPNHTLCFNYTMAQAVGHNLAWSVVKSDVEGDLPWNAVNGVFDPRVNQWIYGDRKRQRLASLVHEAPTQFGEPAESIFYSPFIDLEDFSIDQLEIRTIPGQSLEDVRVFISLTYDGRIWSREWSIEYSKPADWNLRLIARRLGYVRHNVAFKFRVVSLFAVAFTDLQVEYG